MPSSRNRISVHHVGARGASGDFFSAPSFEDDFAYTLYEADADAEVTASPGQHRVKVVNACIGRGEAGRAFHIMRHPPSSSLYEGNPAMAEFCLSVGGTDASFAVERRIVKDVEVETRPLSMALCAELGVPPPDILALDVQGAEGEILESADPALLDDVLAVFTEVHMAQIYKGAKTFGDIFSFLANQGFYFVDFQREARFRPARSPVGFQGRGFYLEADVIFLKDVARLKTRPDTADGVRQRAKLAFVALLLKQIDYALVCLRGVNWNAVAEEGRKRPRYLDLMRELDAVHAAHAATLPPVMNESFALSPEVMASLARFRSLGDNPVFQLLQRYGLSELAHYFGEEARLTAEDILALIQSATGGRDLGQASSTG